MFPRKRAVRAADADVSKKAVPAHRDFSGGTKTAETAFDNNGVSNSDGSDNRKVEESEKRFSLASPVEDFAGDEWTETKTDVPAGSETDTREDGGKRYSLAYQNAAEDSGILDLIQKVKSGESKHDEFENLGIVPDDVAQRIYEITGIDVHGFKSAIEARQIEHIIKDHGENGQTDHSMALDSDIAKLRFTLDAPDDIRAAGITNAYSTKPTPQGFSRSAKTVLYEKSIGSKSYYAVQAVPDTKKKNAVHRNSVYW